MKKVYNERRGRDKDTMQVIATILAVNVKSDRTNYHARWPLLECGVECIVGITKTFPSSVRNHIGYDVGRSFHENGRETGLEVHISDRVNFRTRIGQENDTNQCGSGGTKGLGCLR
jgi:hypothetical protein